MPSGRNGHTDEFRREKKIPLKRVMSLPLFDERPSYKKVYHWVRHGFYGVKLQSRREGKMRMTSVEAVERFLEAIKD